MEHLIENQAQYIPTTAAAVFRAFVVVLVLATIIVIAVLRPVALVAVPPVLAAGASFVSRVLS